MTSSPPSSDEHSTPHTRHIMPDTPTHTSPSPADTTTPRDTFKPTSPTTPSSSSSSLVSSAAAVQVPYAGLQTWARNLADAGQRGITSVTEPLSKSREWNTQNLGMRLAGDLTAAAAAGGLVAPLISIIDRGIIENASNRRTLTQSIIAQTRTLLLKPHIFLTSKPFLLIFALYGGTYLSANTLDTFSSTVKARPPSSVTSGTSKFLTTSATNLSLCLYKDSQFTKMFGSSNGGAGKVPPITYGLFAVRDCLTVFASFNVPPVLAPMLPISGEMEKYASRASVAQFLAPAAVQVLSTPLHLLGLDLYNRPMGEGVSRGSRVQKVIRDWGKSCLARICRIVPAFGVGGVVNMGVRGRWMRALEDGK